MNPATSTFYPYLNIKQNIYFTNDFDFIIFFKKSPFNYSTIWLAVASIAFALGYGTPDAFLYLIPAFLCFAIWIGIGLAGLTGILRGRLHMLGIFSGLVFIAILMIQAWNHRALVDASHDARAELFGKSVLAIAPKHAVVFAEGDEAI